MIEILKEFIVPANAICEEDNNWWIFKLIKQPYDQELSFLKVLIFFSA